MKLADLKAIDMKAGDAGSAFVAGKVDAAVTWEPWLPRAKETPFGHVLLSSDKTPGIIVDSLAFKPDFLKNRGADGRRSSLDGMRRSSLLPIIQKKRMRSWQNSQARNRGIHKKRRQGFRFYGVKENKDYFGTPKKTRPSLHP